MINETIRITPAGREKLSKLKAKTGIQQWNILCRWAFCVSLAEPTKPRPLDEKQRAIEIEWGTFAGEYSELYHALLINRMHNDGVDFNNQQAYSQELHAHIHRGIAYMAGENRLRSIQDMLNIYLTQDNSSPI